MDPKGMEKLVALVENHRKLICRVAGKYPHSGLSADDLSQAVFVSLAQASGRFRRRACEYAAQSIRWSAFRVIANQGRLIRLPVHRTDSIVKMNRTLRRLAHEYDRSPSDETLAGKMNLSPGRMQRLREAAALEPVSIDAPTGEDSDARLADYIAAPRPSPEAQVIEKDRQARIDAALRTLSPREELVVRLRFGFAGNPPTLEDIARRFSVTREGVRQIEARALQKLRRPSRSRLLMDYSSQK